MIYAMGGVGASADVARLDLLASFLDRAEPSKEWLDYLDQHRINLSSVFHRDGLLGLCRLKWLPTRRFKFDDAGMLAAVCTALDEDGNIVDLVGWPVHRPDKFAPALGTVAVLGIDQVDDADVDRLRVWRTPLAWLRHRCRGVVIVDEDRAAFHLGGAPGTIVAEDREHARELSRLLRRHVDAPIAAPAADMQVAA